MIFLHITVYFSRCMAYFCRCTLYQCVHEWIYSSL